MLQARLATGTDVTHFKSVGLEALLTSLTWDGHEVVDALVISLLRKKRLGLGLRKAKQSLLLF